MSERSRPRSPTVRRLVDHLVGGMAPTPALTLPDELADELAGWASASPRFRAFAEAHRDKIRKKLRTAGDADALHAVRAELAVAHRLLGDRRMTLAYEAAGARAGGPDFEVAFRGERHVMLEVTRVRSTGSIAGPILAKLRQLPPSVPNVLLLAAGLDRLEDIGGIIGDLRRVADAGDDAPFTARGLAGARDFRSRVPRLGAVVVWREEAERDHRVTAWVNAAARIPVPESVLRALVAALG